MNDHTCDMDDAFEIHFIKKLIDETPNYSNILKRVSIPLSECICYLFGKSYHSDIEFSSQNAIHFLHKIADYIEKSKGKKYEESWFFKMWPIYEKAREAIEGSKFKGTAENDKLEGTVRVSHDRNGNAITIYCVNPKAFFLWAREEKLQIPHGIRKILNKKPGRHLKENEEEFLDFLAEVSREEENKDKCPTKLIQSNIGQCQLKKHKVLEDLDPKQAKEKLKKLACKLKTRPNFGGKK